MEDLGWRVAGLSEETVDLADAVEVKVLCVVEAEVGAAVAAAAGG